VVIEVTKSPDPDLPRLHSSNYATAWRRSELCNGTIARDAGLPHFHVPSWKARPSPGKEPVMYSSSQAPRGLELFRHWQVLAGIDHPAGTVDFPKTIAVSFLTGS
jgi:hypothetical protein